MKLIKYMSALAISAILVGCGGHSFEGDFQTKAGSQNELINAFAGMAGEAAPTIVTIGKDYVESEGSRENFDEIFVREANDGNKYLVFVSGESEEAWKIVDENTLSQGNGLINIELVRINK
ncbi:hypothetical protein DZF79_28420 [Vibrio parahaemolyticus]|nr:hypothetical protein [Vibrio parahaemolyticus]